MLEIRHNSKFYYLIDQKFGDRKKIEKELSVYWYLLKTQELKEKI